MTSSGDMHGGIPTFSVIVPTYNRPAPLARCLGALAAMDYPPDRFEVIVVDDGGSCDLKGIVESFRQRINLTFLRQHNSGPAAARNAGVAAARNCLLAFTDDDCAPHSDWLRQLVPPLLADASVMVGGECINALSDNLLAVASQTIIEVVNLFFNSDPCDCTFFPSDNIAMSREYFARVDGFDVDFRCAEDRDLCDRWTAKGWKIVYAAGAKVDHAHKMGLWGFCRQHFGYGRGAWRFHRARARRRSGRLQVEGSFYVACLRRPFQTQPLWRATKLALILCVWQITNTAGFVYEALIELRGRPGNGEAATKPHQGSPSPREAKVTE